MSQTVPPSLDYEPYDVRLCRLRWSFVAALTSGSWRREADSVRCISSVSACLTVSRAQCRAQLRFLTCPFARSQADGPSRRSGRQHGTLPTADGFTDRLGSGSCL